jgi:hypothetical protein
MEDENYKKKMENNLFGKRPNWKMSLIVGIE